MKLQFRLRTLMIAVTLLAVPLGYVGWQAKDCAGADSDARRNPSRGRQFDFPTRTRTATS